MASETSSSADHIKATGVLDRAVRGSRLFALCDCLAADATELVENAALYWWFTAEPDPPVTVDLRTTAIVAPFVELTGTIAPPLQRAWHHSTAVDAVTALPGDRALGVLAPAERPAQTMDDNE